MVVHAQAQVWVGNMEMECNHVYYAALHNQEIQECEKAIFEQTPQNKPQQSQKCSLRCSPFC